MTRRAVLTIKFRSWWLSGTGGGRGRLLDAACYRDADNLPAMPMSQVKGTLRETAERLAEAGRAGWNGDLVKRIFGGRSDETGQSAPGAVSFFGDAAISENDRIGLVGEAAGKRRETLYQRIASTAVDEQGTARDHTLRYVEAAVPVTLEGRLEWTDGSPDSNWVAVLDAAAAATVAFGKLKADGYGTALANVTRVEEAAAARPSSAGGLHEARRVRLQLTQTSPAIFSAHAATEGAHKTTFSPTGGTLLGWAARNYADFADPYAVFHGGVRFGTAAPLGPDGTVCVPMPKLFMAPKHRLAGGVKGDRIDTETVRIGRSPTTSDEPIQYKEIDKAPFVTPTGFVVKPTRGQRLRTATKSGRAAQNQLFGLEHLSAQGNPVFVATVERDDTVGDDDWARLMESFADQTLRLGRARGTSYGGEYRCAVEAAPEESGTVPKGAKRLRVLAVSDLALADEFGAPRVEPDHAMLGLPPARFVGAESALSLRRWASWNAAIEARDVDRQVIEAGSVLVFDLDHPLDKDRSAHDAVGLWREIGLGQIWISPPFLEGPEGEKPRFGDADNADGTCAPPQNAKQPTSRSEESDLAKWCDARLSQEKGRRYA